MLDVVTRYAIERERPDWRGTFSGTYAASHWHLLGRVSYYGTFASAQPGYTDDSVESYGARTLFDTELGYKFQTMDFSVGARNVTDVYPGKPTKDYNNNYGVFPYAAASPFGYNGRYVYTKLTWQMPR